MRRDLRTAKVFGGLAAASLAWVACGPAGDQGAAVAKDARFGPFTNRVAATAETTPKSAPTELNAPLDGTRFPLAVLRSAYSPVTVWQSRESRLTLFAELATSGLGGPAFLAYSSPTGIATLRPGAGFEGTEMRENWLLTGFPGATGWTNWDSPWGVFFEHRPQRVTLGTNGVEVEFAGPAGTWSMLPVYGYGKPPAQGKPHLGKPPAKGKALLTWEWPIVVAVDPLTRVRYWAGATRRFPWRLRETASPDVSLSGVHWKAQFDWWELSDQWNTRPIRLAPVSPALGLDLAVGGGRRVEFSRAPFNYEIPTPSGPFYAVPDVDGYEVTLPFLREVLETTRVTPGSGAAHSPVVTAAQERLGREVREWLKSGEGWEPASASVESRLEALAASAWLAQALPWLDAPLRTETAGVLRRMFLQRVFVDTALPESEWPAGSGRIVRSLAGANARGEANVAFVNSVLLEALWQYVDHSADWALVREQWSWIRPLFVGDAVSHWQGASLDQGPEAGRGAVAAVAMARLAYLAGDGEIFARATALAGRELANELTRVRGGSWFRDHQAWHSMTPLGTNDVPLAQRSGAAGWTLGSVAIPEGEGVRRWSCLGSFDLARFYRDHARAEVAAELKAQPASRADDGFRHPSALRLDLMLGRISVTNLAEVATPASFQGTPAGVVATCLAVLHAAEPNPPRERLMDAGTWNVAFPGPRAANAPADAELIVGLNWSGQGASVWPRLTWPRWRTPTGEVWNFGEVRAGTNTGPLTLQSRALNEATEQTWVLPSAAAP